MCDQVSHIQTNYLYTLGTDCIYMIACHTDDNLAINFLALTCHDMQDSLTALNLFHPNNLKYQIILNLAAQKGHIGILQWMRKQKEITGNDISDIIMAAVKGNQVCVLEWLRTFTLSSPPNTSAWKNIVLHKEVFMYLLELHGVNLLRLRPISLKNVKFEEFSTEELVKFISRTGRYYDICGQAYLNSSGDLITRLAMALEKLEPGTPQIWEDLARLLDEQNYPKLRELIVSNPAIRREVKKIAIDQGYNNLLSYFVDMQL